MASCSNQRTRSVLTEEQQTELVADYVAGMRRVDISAKYALFPTQIYAYLRRRGVQANRLRRSSSLTCCVCGHQREMPAYSPSSRFRALATCGDEACKSILLFRPEIRKHHNDAPCGRKNSWVRHYIEWPDHLNVETYDEITDLDAAELAALEAAFELGVNDIGEDISPEARKSLWGRLSMLSVAVHLRSEEAADTAITLPAKRPLATFLRRYFGKDTEESAAVADAFDVLYLWRCRCPQQETYVLRSTADLPTAPGEYGTCTTCSAAALVIK